MTEKAKKPAVDEESLNKLKHPFTIDLLKLRKLLKIRDTYLAQFKREVHDGKMHPFYDLNIAETGRSSSSLPNFQNIPVRDEEAKRSVRTGIIPRPGEELIEVDYKAMEVRIMACYSHDPNLIRYIEDPTTDMHRDQAVKIFMLPPDQITKTLRHNSKNGFVFPQFYGDWYKSCAGYIWNELPNETLKDGTPVLEWLASKKIGNLTQFERHMQWVENDFWNHLQVTKQWREDILDFYRRKGYVPTFFGFHRNGYLSNNQVGNAPVQGTAFHCLLWACIEINKIRKADKWRSALLAQIHDSLIASVHPSEREEVLQTMRWVMCDALREAHPWIIVPMEVEFATSGIDGSWADKKEFVLQ
jgi:DNA polymerase-1